MELIHADILVTHWSICTVNNSIFAGILGSKTWAWSGMSCQLFQACSWTAEVLNTLQLHLTDGTWELK